MRRLCFVSRFGQRAESRSLNRGRCAGGRFAESVTLAPSGDRVGVVDEPVDEAWRRPWRRGISRQAEAALASDDDRAAFVAVHG